ncbi:3,4-dihydroxy-2-butanone-4-phosphate synthase [Candidatus Gracilibacteria bacterium]|nr:3,4-dihydroxy-2-butanone-4-phosphate synthase [Candidatus Gracilibacteria bacterium]
MKFHTIDKALQELHKGNFIIVFDEYRECEGDFFLLAEHVTPEKINFLLTQAKGMICVACDEAIIQRIQLPQMTQKNKNAHHTNFCLSVDACHGISTGISAKDRSTTIKLLAIPTSTSSDFVSPGHTFPLLAKNKKDRFGHTEAAVELAKHITENQAVVICEILDETGEKMDQKSLQKMSEKFQIPILSLELIRTFVT